MTRLSFYNTPFLTLQAKTSVDRLQESKNKLDGALRQYSGTPQMAPQMSNQGSVRGGSVLSSLPALTSAGSNKTTADLFD